MKLCLMLKEFKGLKKSVILNGRSGDLRERSYLAMLLTCEK